MALFGAALIKWLIGINDNHNDYAEKVAAQFRAEGLRADVDYSNESVNKKVRTAQLDQVNYILVVGDREIEEGTVTVRAANKVLGAKPVTDVITALKDEYAARSFRKNEV